MQPQTPHPDKSTQAPPETEEEVQALFAQMQREHRSVLRATRLMKLLLGVTLVVFLWLVFSPPDLAARPNFLTAGLFIWLGMMITGSWRVQSGEIKRLATLKQITQSDNPQCVAWLVEALFSEYEPAKKLAGEALLILLPRLKAEDARHLTPRQRKLLRGLVDNPLEEIQTKDPFPHRQELYRAQYAQRAKPLALILLKAYEQIGDESDLPAVQRIANGVSALGSDPELRAAAQECLPFLQAHSERTMTTKTLLRASAPPEAAPAELLRPAVTATPTDPEQLLRPTIADSHNSEKEPV